MVNRIDGKPYSARLPGLIWTDKYNKLVEAAGIEPASASPLQTVLHT